MGEGREFKIRMSFLCTMNFIQKEMFLDKNMWNNINIILTTFFGAKLIANIVDLEWGTHRGLTSMKTMVKIVRLYNFSVF